MPELSYATGWYPWLPLTRIEHGHTPYNYEMVEICRADFDAPQVVAPRSLHPTMNVVDLWWRPVREQGRSRPATTLTPAAQRAYATWFRLTWPLAGGVVPDWQLLEPATRVLWKAIAQAVLAADDDAQALAERVWARQAPSSRWLEVRPEATAPTDTEDDTHG
jgi:hypothetical protein